MRLSNNTFGLVLVVTDSDAMSWSVFALMSVAIGIAMWIAESAIHRECLGRAARTESRSPAQAGLENLSVWNARFRRVPHHQLGMAAAYPGPGHDVHRRPEHCPESSRGW